jgi:hypothetical protein
MYYHWQKNLKSCNQFAFFICDGFYLTGHKYVGGKYVTAHFKADVYQNYVQGVSFKFLPHTRVWQELECRIDVCRVTRGSHIEHL